MSSGKPRERIAFQGERGAFSEEAAIRLLGEQISLVPRPTFEALFSTIREGAADAILAPIENSLAGSVHRCYDLLLESSLVITGEVIHPIAHNVIGIRGSALESLTSVESHPVALAQCENFFRAHPHIKRIASEDTAGSVRAVMEQGDPRRGAIAARRAAEIYGGQILQEHVEDHRENYTRFLLLRPAGGPATSGDKLSLAVQLAHKPGSLHRALGIFSGRGINLSKIESRPIPGSPWTYRFYLDLQTSLDASETRQALEELKSCTETVRVLGCYPAYAGGGPVNKSPEGEDA
ncbi:MAG TPA: prephenate dehydratase [Verrucomicrobiae bacterium]|nr:prephenate dehydratase [Verrucomicrobiae bacterium]